MAKKNNTLSDLNDFLRENPNEIEIDGATTKEEFISKQPSTLVDIPQAEKFTSESIKLENVSLKDIATYLHSTAKKQDKSFAEVWMELLKEASAQDPLLENTSIFQALKSVRKTSTSVISDGITHFMNSRKK